MSQVTITSVKRHLDDVNAVGTVDGVQTLAHLWFSYLVTLPDVQSRKIAIATALRDAAPPPDTDLTATYSGTVTV